MYAVEFKLEAQEDLARLDKQVAQRILKKIQWLAENFDELTPEALKGKWRGKYKLRVGDYRVIYDFVRARKKQLVVHLVGHRREIYKTR